MLRALGSAFCDLTHQTGGTMRLRISHTRKGLRYVTGIGFCVLRYHTRDRGCDLLRTLRSASCDNTHTHTRQEVRFVLRALGSASSDITHETGGTICYGHWVLRLVISHARQGIRLVTGIGFCLL